MSADLADQLHALLKLHDAMGAESFAQTLATLRERYGAAAVDAELARLTPSGVSVTIAATSGTVKDSPVHVVGHANSVTFQAPADPAAPRRADALSAYLRRTSADCNALPLGQIDRTDADHTRPLQLARLYISLHTTQQITLTDAEIAALPKEIQPRLRNAGVSESAQRPTRPLPAIEAIGDPRQRHVMLLGAPGSGKSTLVSHLALCLAGAALCAHQPDAPSPAHGRLASLPRWQRGDLLPVRVILRDLAAFAPLAQAPKGSLRLLEAFLTATLAEAGCAEAGDVLVDALRNGQAILLFDGFDEVVGAPVLARVAETIQDAGRGYAAPIVVTCRILDYHEERLRQLTGFPTLTLAELEDRQIHQFVGDWYAELAASGRRPAAQTEADTQALRDALSTRPELRALAGTPLLLTVMALVHAFRGTLPDARALIYAECIDLLLLRWRQPRGESDLLERLGLPQFRSNDLLALMARLGYEAHLRAERAEAQGGPADLDEPTLMALLAEGFARYDEPHRYQLAELVLRALTRGNGLLLKRGPQVYTFAHRTFQEVLAGYHLKSQRDYRKVGLERAPQAHWHEVLTLMVGYQVLQDRELEKPLSLVEALLGRSPLEQALAGELLVLIGRERAAAYDPALLVLPGGLWPRARTALLHLQIQGRAPEVPAPLRHRAGLALGLLCYGPLESLDRPTTQVPMPDPRLPFAVIGLPAQASQGWPKALAHYWCPIEAGPFWSRDDRPQRRDNDENLLQRARGAVRREIGGQSDGPCREPLRQAEIRRSYQIGRYPVTNADFARFLVANGPDGYDPARPWWTEHGRAYLRPGGFRFEGEPRQITNPRFWQQGRYQNPLQPVVGVSWYEAAAYCRWLTMVGHQQRWLPLDSEIRLPTWLEWERAARHIDQRRHPWGDPPPDPKRVNYDASEIGLPSPTGCFPAGAAICGAQDLLGNVMEWTATSDKAPGQIEPAHDFTRGDIVIMSYSSYDDSAEHLCCGARLKDSPSIRIHDWSFRVVLSLRAHV